MLYVDDESVFLTYFDFFIIDPDVLESVEDLAWESEALVRFKASHYDKNSVFFSRFRYELSRRYCDFFTKLLYHI